MIQVTHFEEIRISASAFCRVLSPDGRYALLRNANSSKHGETVFSPIGGGIGVTEEGMAELQETLGVVPAGFEEDRYLRFTLPGRHATRFRHWFLTSPHREADPRRELVEELCEENHLVPAGALAAAWFTLAGYDAEVYQTRRVGAEGQWSLRLSEVFDVHLPSEVLRGLVGAATDPESVLQFATRDDLVSGVTSRAHAIARTAQCLIAPWPRLPEID